ncbi:MAG TPA: 2-C-methyl-D-erythritol 4-phosphate cytidylyltransferase [Burkholderiales bacterium]|jgi:2-C-methyl-D-erythritol 4-phosphate cytidylyltransferase|nr:2-C-methyl-D-erythritol 4-phosphate cytidylyltransferase [Burkholderiales bacterium]
MTARYFGLVPAAGSGSRFGADGLKQYSPLAGKPMLYHSIERLLAAPEVEVVFVVLAPADTDFRTHDWSAFGQRLAPLYCGGASRRDSVLNGIVAAASAVDPNDWMLVHDAARPCLGKAELRRLMDEAGRDEVGGILAIPVADTLKRADDEHRILATEPRDGLWRAQTPQMFRHGMLLRALREAEHVTDDASAVEALGYKPKLVEGSAKNLKVTFAADLEIAERLLKAGA